MDTEKRTWYERNRLQIRLIQFLLYHLKKDGYEIKRTNEKRKGDILTPLEIIEKPTSVSFD